MCVMRKQGGEGGAGQWRLMMSRCVFVGCQASEPVKLLAVDQLVNSTCVCDCPCH